MLIGHQKQWQLLRKMIKAERIPHALLFFGQEQLGKKTVALEIIKMLNCSAENFNNKPCQNCRNCQDIEKKVFPDLTIVEPILDEESSKDEIKISQIRKLHSGLSLSTYLARWKSVIIDRAHCLNQQAQSAFLKLLEEPKGDTIFILITEYPEILLPTIRSRCETIKFLPVATEEIEEGLKDRGLSTVRAKEIAGLSLGKPGRAIDFFQDPKKLQNQEEMVKEIDELIQSDLAVRFQYAKNLAQQGHQNIREILDVWLRRFREKMVENINSVTLSGSEGSRYSLARLKKILERISRTQLLLSTTNVNKRLALEILMLEL